MSTIEEFLNSDLISWLESCISRPELLSGLPSLLDGHLIHSVWLQIDPEPSYHPAKIVEQDGLMLTAARAKNFDAIIKNLKNLYEEEFGQTVLMFPDCYVIGHQPESKSGLEQMKLLLTLLLGAAVQCPNKELFIARIKELHIDIQHGIVDVIKKVTDSQTLVLTPDFEEMVAPNKMIEHIVRLAKERDKYHSHWIQSLNSDETIATSNQKSNNSSSTVISPSVSASSTASAVSSSENNHLAVELADLKAKMRKIRQELEEKSEGFMETKEELEHTRHQYEKLKHESTEWYLEARKANAYRDEVDVLRERAERVERLEVEIQRFREKLSDVEFYKTRVEELREDNRVLLDTKEMLEEQLQRSRKRSDHALALESEILKYKQKLNDMTLERDAEKNKMQELLDENIQLQLSTKNLGSGPDSGEMRSDDEEDPLSGDNSLSEQLTNNATTRALKLELENRRLLAALDTLKESTFRENSIKILELEKEKKKLQLKGDQLQDNCDRLNQQIVELESVFKDALAENQKLQDVVDTKQQQLDKTSHEKEVDRGRQMDLDSQIESLTKEKQRVQILNESIQRRATDLEKSLDIKTKEQTQLQEQLVEFDKVKKEIVEVVAKLNTAEKETTNLNRELVKTKENLEKKDIVLDSNNEQLKKQEKEIKHLNRELETTTQSLAKVKEFEKQNQELQSQKKVDSETINTLQEEIVSSTIASKKLQQDLEKIGIDRNEISKEDLNVDFLVKKLVKNPESFKTVREIMLSVNKENRERTSANICVLCHHKETYTVEKDLHFTVEVPNTKEENLMVQEQLEHFKTEYAAVNDLNATLQAENARQTVQVSTMGSQITSLSNQQVALQLANSQLATEKDCLMKKVDGVKTQYESIMQDQVTLQCLHEQLSSDYDALNKEKEILKTTIRDIKLDNRSLKERSLSMEKLVEELQMELDEMKKGSASLSNLRAEHSKLKDDFRNLFTTSERLKHEYKNIQDQYRLLRTENAKLNIQNTELSGNFNNRLDHATGMEIELTKVKQQNEMLQQMNSSLDADRRQHMDHVSQLLNQYHELLTHSLEDKQHYHTEEKMFTDKVNDLKRQKEKLEEKIMEHYRKLESCSPKKKPLVSNIVKKVKKAGSDLMNIVPSKNRRSWMVEETPRLSLVSQSQSQIILNSEPTVDSDNSAEDRASVASDNTLLQRNIPIRQSLQRKTSEQIQSVLMRGGIRGSLQPVKREENAANRNSFQGFESPPDVTANALGGLGDPGSRRTVYLVDENKIEESAAESTPDPPPPSTFLMYNKITTNIGGSGGSAASETNGVNGSSAENQKAKGDNQKKKNDQKNRESAVWYEYGCV